MVHLTGCKSDLMNSIIEIQFTGVVFSFQAWKINEQVAERLVKTNGLGGSGYQALFVELNMLLLRPAENHSTEAAIADLVPVARARGLLHFLNRFRRGRK